MAKTAMGPLYWKRAWEEGRTGFHQRSVNPRLASFVDRLTPGRDATVFVPLCGKSLDMLWLRDMGYRVVGVEVSTLAVAAFVHENSLETATETSGDFLIHRTEGITIFEGDFFRLRPAMLGDIAAVYDRAALIALPVNERRRYARHIGKLTPSSGNVLLITIEHAGTASPGPPFSVPAGEVERIYASDFEVEMLLQEDILNTSQRFQDLRATLLLERIFMLRRR